MADTTRPDKHEGDGPGVSRPQALLDDLLFLLGVGLMVPMLLYVICGLIELAGLPPSR